MIYVVDRARITVADLVYILMGLAFVGALYPVLTDSIQANAATIPTGALYLFQLILPLALLILLWTIWRKATVGA